MEWYFCYYYAQVVTNMFALPEGYRIYLQEPQQMGKISLTKKMVS